MSNSNYNFRTALREVKETKESQLSIKVDQFLRNVINEINNKSVDICKEMLDEILFLQYDYGNSSYYSGRTIKVYIRKLNLNDKNYNIQTDDKSDLDSYLYITEYSCDTVEEASTLLKAIRSKLESEDFEIEPYNGEHNGKDGQSFILYDCDYS